MLTALWSLHRLNLTLCKAFWQIEADVAQGWVGFYDWMLKED